jgi:hypothetical protein
MPWELVIIKLKTIDSLIAAVTEEGSIFVHFPLVVGDHSGAVVVCDIVSDHIYFAMLANFIEVLVRPHTSHHQIGCPFWFETNQILHDGCVLHGSTSLLEENPEVVRHLEEFSYLIFGQI